MLAFGGITFAAVERASSPQRQLEAAYTRFNAALKNRDAQALSSLLAPEFQEQRLKGEFRNRAEAEANYQQIFQDWIAFDCQTVEIDRLTTQGNEATVIANKVASGTMTDRAGAFGPKGANHKVVTNTMDVDVWVKTSDGWKFKSRQIAMAELSVDGKLIHSDSHTHHAHEDEDHTTHQTAE